MNPAQPVPAPRRHRLLWWGLLGAGLCLTPFVLLGVAAVSYLTLDSDVRALRRHVMAASDAEWSPKAQVSVGRFTLGAVGQALRFVERKDIADARLALRAVRNASVGVYERTSSDDIHWSRGDLFLSTDRVMRERGWTRLVGVSECTETVLVYVPVDFDEGDPLELCVAVLSGREMVVASTTIDAPALGELVSKHAKRDEIKRQLQFSKLKL